MAEEIQDPWKQARNMYEAVLLSLGVGASKPQVASRSFANGMKSPPFRAPVEGMAGETAASVNTYAGTQEVCQFFVY